MDRHTHTCSSIGVAFLWSKAGWSCRGIGLWMWLDLLHMHACIERKLLLLLCLVGAFVSPLFNFLLLPQCLLLLIKRGLLWSIFEWSVEQYFSSFPLRQTSALFSALWCLTCDILYSSVLNFFYRAFHNQRERECVCVCVCLTVCLCLDICMTWVDVCVCAWQYVCVWTYVWHGLMSMCVCMTVCLCLDICMT